MPTVDSLDIQISTSLKNTDKMIDNLIAKLNVLNSSLSRIGGASANISSGMTKMTSSATKSTKSFNGLAAAFGRFYANYFLLVRAIKGFNKAITGTADYIEAFNYFEVSFNKIAKEWKQDFSKYGYESAESYAKSFAERANDTLSKLSGVQVSVGSDRNGLLTETGMKNLGLNIQEITQYASQLASVTNSIGQTGEVSLRASDAFTKLAGDISSLFNVDYSSVAKNLQSGLIGQSRALYKYGIDITNATLQTYAYELGLEKAVSEMTQAEKMQLRMIAILDQSKVSWGDLANTINSPSNMIRQFKNNLKEAGMMLGQLFIPMLGKVLPVLNGVTIAIKRLLGNIAGFLGIKIDFSEFGQGGVDASEDMTDLSDSLDDVTESAKKAKAGLRGFDELKTINMPDSSGGSSGGVGGAIDLTDEILRATEEYEKVWQEAYDKMEQRAQKFADSIGKYFEPIQKLFKDIKKGDWFAVGEDVSGMANSIFDLLNLAFEKTDWDGFGTNVGNFISGSLSNAFKGLPKVANLISNSIIGINTFLSSVINSTNWYDLSQSLITGITGFIKNLQIGEIMNSITDLINSITDATVSVLDYIADNPKDFADLMFTLALAIMELLVSAVQQISSTTTHALGGVIGTIFANSFGKAKEWFAGIGEWFGTHVVEPIKKVWTPIATWFDDNVVEPIGDFFEGFSKRASQIFEGLKIIVQAIWITVSGWFDENVVQPIVNFFEPIIEKISGFFEKAWTKIKDIWKGVSNWFEKNITEPLGKVWEKVTNKIGNLFSSLWSGIKNGIVNTMNSAIGGIEKAINFIVTGINKIIKGFNKIVSWAAKVAEVNWGGVDLVPKVSISRIQAYEVGGFPDRASLFWANENGVPELVGTMGGKTAVASGMEITGIKDAIYSTGQQETNLMQTMVGLLKIIAEKEYGITDSEIGKSAQRYARDYFNRTGNEAYSF